MKKPTKQQIEARISRAMGDGEDTPEVDATIDAAKDLVEQAYRAGKSSKKNTVGDALATLFGATSNRGAEALEALALSEGWLWQCPCGWNNSTDETVCEECKREHATVKTS